MKEYEKFAEDYILNIKINDCITPFDIADGFEAGFLKAREMVFENVKENESLWAACDFPITPDIIRLVMETGEKEV